MGGKGVRQYIISAVFYRRKFKTAKTVVYPSVYRKGFKRNGIKSGGDFVFDFRKGIFQGVMQVILFIAHLKVQVGAARPAGIPGFGYFIAFPENEHIFWNI